MKFEFSPHELKVYNTCLMAAQTAQNILLDGSLKIKNVEEKEAAGLVTQFDRMSEEAIRKVVKTAFPNHRIVGEEFGDDKSSLLDESPVTWFIDPLDGTTNFIYGFPVFAVSIAVYEGQKPLIGMVFAPILKKEFIAVKNRGAFCNGSRLQVSSQSRLQETLLATGFASQSKKGLDDQIEILRKVLHLNRGVRRAGAAALDLCWVAEGVFDGFWEFELSPWDTAAGALIVEEAGGKISSADGSEFSPFSKSVVATNHFIHEELLQLMKS